MKNFKKYLIKIPSTLKIIYCEKKKIITIIGFLTKKSLKIPFKILLINNKIIKVSNVCITKNTNLKKTIENNRGTLISNIKQICIEVSNLVYSKLKLIGVGYKIFELTDFNTILLNFKLGFSHSIYFKLSNKFKVYCLKFTKLFITNKSYKSLSQLASLIREFKKPEPYKGKGITYINEKIVLKEGKKK